MKRSRRILYLNLTAFPIEVERLLDPTLRNRPVVMAPLKSDRSLVWEVSSEARDAGLEKGMPLAFACKILKDVLVLPPRPDIYLRANKKIEEEILAKVTPLYEIDKLGHAYLDLTGFDRLYGDLSIKAHKIQKDFKERFGLTPSLGSSQSKMVSKVAAKSVRFSKDVCLVETGKEVAFLSPLPISVLPIVRTMVKKSSLRKDSIFEDLNLNCVSDILALSDFALEVVFGEEAKRVREMALGKDTTPVFPPKKGPMIFEEMYLKEDTNDLIELRNVLKTLIEKAVFALRKDGYYAGKVILSFRYSDCNFVSLERRVKPASQSVEVFSSVVLKMFQQLFQRRARIQFLKVEFDELINMEIQLNLFETESERKSKAIRNTMDSIREKFKGPLPLVYFGHEISRIGGRTTRY